MWTLARRMDFDGRRRVDALGVALGPHGVCLPDRLPMAPHGYIRRRWAAGPLAGLRAEDEGAEAPSDLGMVIVGLRELLADPLQTVRAIAGSEGPERHAGRPVQCSNNATRPGMMFET